MEHHKTKDPYRVKQFESGSDEFTVKVATNPEKVKELLEVGFDYVCEKDGLIFLGNVNNVEKH